MDESKNQDEVIIEELEVPKSPDEEEIVVEEEKIEEKPEEVVTESEEREEKEETDSTGKNQVTTEELMQKLEQLDAKFTEKIETDEHKDQGSDKDQVTTEELMQKLEQLDTKFTKKIQTDEHKNQLFDKLHQQLKIYEDDVIAMAINPIIMEMIQLLDSLKAQRQYFPEEVSQENYEKLVKKFDGAIEDVQDLLEELDVDIYSVEGAYPDPKRQKIVKVIPTVEKERNNTIAKKVSDGYIRQNHIVKYEKIAIYKYQEDKEDGNK